MKVEDLQWNDWIKGYVIAMRIKRILSDQFRLAIRSCVD